MDISINVSHETNPIPTEIDVYPKNLNIDQAIYTIRCLISHVVPSPALYISITNWIDNVFPPQLYDEINYTTLQNASDLFFENDARLTSSITLKKKVFSNHVYMKLKHLLESLNWSASPAVEFYEWAINTTENTLKYHMADREMFFGLDSLVLGEKIVGVEMLK